MSGLTFSSVASLIMSVVHRLLLQDKPPCVTDVEVERGPDVSPTAEAK